MTIPHVQRGTAFRDVLTADTWNGFVDAANDYRRRGMRLNIAQPRGYETQNSTVMIQNNSGSDLDQGHILAMGAPLIGPTANLTEFKARSGWAGATPTLADHGKFVVLAEPIANTKIGLGIIAGIAVARVNFQIETLDRCDVGTTTQYLDAKPEGTAQVLWKESGTGQKWAAIRLGALRDAMVVGKTNAEVLSGATAAVTMWINGIPTAYDVPAVKLDWMHGGQKISADKEVLAAWFASERLWRFIGSECE